ncbi:tetratricopeptide repeat protein [Marinigracilibium pacificum]|uniref:Tetratricopeptide repeat protein n=1 Tax=Marinigracilibium pacificum TaxID=2729599 RepID=A0A848J1D4_9BACT|nr:tetratricopeptide repeat protein [Marinigracilibium pacificum]NMM49158.1 tetratricopeptide repeat protein [Marinigracilibium pacificum]
MTQARKLVFAAAITGLLALSGCSLSQMTKAAKDQQLTVTPNPLEVHGDTVEYEMSAVLPVKMLKKGKVYTIKNYYVYGDQEVSVGEVSFKAEDYPNAKETEPRESKTFSFPYEPAMSKGELQVMGVSSNPENGKFKETERMTVAPGIITTSKLVENPFFAAYADHGYNNQEELIPTNINFYFLQGSSVLRSSEKRSDRGSYFSGFIAEKNVTRTVTITGSHSPEGSETINTGLAGNRAKVIEDYYRNQMDRYDYQGAADSINFILKEVVRDWTPLKDSLANYEGLSSEEKQQVYDIVNGPGVFEEKEKQLQKLPFYRTMFRDVYPKLRFSETEILTVKEKKTDAEISVLAKGIASGSASADTLSMEELLYAATLTPSLDEKEAIYKAAIAKEDNWVAHNNLSAVYLEKAKQSGSDDMVSSAINEAEISNRMEANAPAHMNMATAYAMQGNYQKAYAVALDAASMSATADNTAGLNGVKGALQIMRAEYGPATTSLSNATETPVNLYNKGLAQLLNGENQKAMSSFEDAIAADSDFAKAHYAAAVTAARSNNADQAISHLGQAVTLDPSLKQKALGDLEFASMAGNAAFTEALK